MSKKNHIKIYESWSGGRLRLRQFNYRLLARMVGLLLVVLAVSLVVPLAVSIYCRDGAQFALALAGVIILMAGLILRNIVGRNVIYDLHELESFWITLVSWLMLPIFGTLPYLFTGSLGTFTDALFESFSGFTTTGSSVMLTPEEAPAGLLCYRSMTQWIGGLGLMLFAVAILKRLDIGAGHLYEAEFSGTQQRKLHPRLSKSVSRMWHIYLAITLIMIVGLLLTGTQLLDAVCLAFSTVSTGGFVTHSDGLTMLSNGSLSVVTVFMFLSGVNVALLYRFFTFKWRNLWRDEELRVYSLLFVVTIVSCFGALKLVGNDVEESLRFAIFHVASTISTCGFFIDPPANWSFWVSVVTFIILIIGASAGSTGGGIKIRRVIILVKYVANYFTRMLHPNVVFCVKVNNEVVPSEYINKIFAFAFMYIAFITGGAFVLTFCGESIPDAMCMAAANISNLGPSPLMNHMGASLDYAMLPNLGKWAMMALMLAGRLEIFALVAVFIPAYWRKSN